MRAPLIVDSMVSVRSELIDIIPKCLMKSNDVTEGILDVLLDFLFLTRDEIDLVTMPFIDQPSLTERIGMRWLLILSMEIGSTTKTGIFRGCCKT